MTDNPEQLQNEINRFLADAREKTGQGDMVDLQGLEEKIRRLCEVILTLQPGEARPYRETLSEIAGELEALRGELEAQQGEVRSQLEGLNLRHKAAKAYKSSEGMQPKPPEEKK